MVPTTAPSATASPFRGAIEPRWVSVTLNPSAVRIESVRPLPATVPANVTSPAAGARTSAPGAPPTSIPRCWPAAYGSLVVEKGRTTAPSLGQDQALAAGASSSAARIAAGSSRRIGLPRWCQWWLRHRR
jgi:hypothetical protein